MTTFEPLKLSRPPRVNHVGLSLPAERLDEAGRTLIGDFHRDVFGFEVLDVMTIDKSRLVLQVHTVEQFVFIHADETPMAAPRFDHFGMSVATEADLDEMLKRAKAWQDRDERVDILDKKVDDFGVLSITAFYARFLLPMMIEVQFWDYKLAT